MNGDILMLLISSFQFCGTLVLFLFIPYENNKGLFKVKLILAGILCIISFTIAYCSLVEYIINATWHKNMGIGLFPIPIIFKLQ